MQAFYSTRTFAVFRPDLNNPASLVKHLSMYLTYGKAQKRDPLVTTQNQSHAIF